MLLHADLPDSGNISHDTIDEQLPTQQEKTALQTIATNIAIEITGARDAPEEALADLLTALATLGVITDSTTAT